MKKILFCRALLLALCAFGTLACASSGASLHGSNHRLRGLYVPNRLASSLEYVKLLVARGKPLGVNMLVMDAHPFMVLRPNINPDVIRFLKKEKIYIAARIVCFQDGLKSLPVPDEYMKRLFSLIDVAAGAGFDEIQLDYIRFPDGAPYYSLAAKYGFIDDLLRRARSLADSRGVRLSADLFGRIVYNRDDIIGQKIENFAKYADVIYPMLYPSHFTGDSGRLADPGGTVREGTLMGLARVKGTGVRIHPFIQAFPYNIGWARVSIDRYVEVQIVAAESTEARGWVAWNAKGEYDCVFRALERL
jgi:hypothetical protein